LAISTSEDILPLADLSTRLCDTNKTLLDTLGNLEGDVPTGLVDSAKEYVNITQGLQKWVEAHA